MTILNPVFLEETGVQSLAALGADRVVSALPRRSQTVTARVASTGGAVVKAQSRLTFSRFWRSLQFTSGIAQHAGRAGRSRSECEIEVARAVEDHLHVLYE